MKKTAITSALAATALILTPALAQEKAEAPSAPSGLRQQGSDAEPEPQPEKQEKEKCLDTEIQNLESALDKVGKALGQRMQQQEKKLAESQTELNKANAESDGLRKKLAEAEAKSKNMATEFAAFKNANEKQRQATMANLAKIEEASKVDATTIAQLEQKNAATEAQCKAASERLQAIVSNLQQVEAELSAAKE